MNVKGVTWKATSTNTLIDGGRRGTDEDGGHATGHDVCPVVIDRTIVRSVYKVVRSSRCALAMVACKSIVSVLD